jgi:hypothetical protein
VKLHWAPGGHGLSAGEMATARTWLATAFPADAYTEA